MKKNILGLCVLFAMPCMANQHSGFIQDVYVVGEYGQHTLGGQSASRLGGLLGARNIYASGFFYGGELAFSHFTNASLQRSDIINGTSVKQNIERDYGYSFYIPAGMQFNITQHSTLNVFGLAGYSYVSRQHKLTVMNETYSLGDSFSGFVFGGGVEAGFSDWLISLRYTSGKLDVLEEESLSLGIGYKLNF